MRVEEFSTRKAKRDARVEELAARKEERDARLMEFEMLNGQVT